MIGLYARPYTFKLRIHFRLAKILEEKCFRNGQYLLPTRVTGERSFRA